MDWIQKLKLLAKHFEGYPNIPEPPFMLALYVMIEDPWNFTANELKSWAFSEEKTIPDQDWELSVANSGYDSLVLDLAQDESCPSNKFMLVCLYMMVGDFLHCELSEPRKKEIITLANKALESKISGVSQWGEKTLNIMKNTSSFVYDEWCWLSENDV